MKLGFIGTGNITTAVVEGLCTLGAPSNAIRVSPRNAEKAKFLAAKFSRVGVAENNQAVLDASDIIFLALRPQVAAPIIRRLRFRDDHRVVSLVAATALDFVCEMVRPARDVIRAVPLPTVARHRGPIILYPDNAEIRAIFGQIGSLFVAESERNLSLLAAITALISPFYALMDETARWAAALGVGRQTAESYTAAMFQALSAQVVDMPAMSFSKLAADAATPGGLNEQALEIIRKNDGFQAFLKALDAVTIRLGEMPPERRKAD
jgi:pyrroline-5-carboxylate reductase